MPTQSGSRALAERSAAGRDDYTRAFQRLVGEVFRLNGRLLVSAERLAADLGISPARWQTIATIRNEPLTVPEIARRLGLSRQSVQRVVNDLLREGLVEHHPNPGHRRSHLIALTGPGRQTMEQLRERQARLTAEFTDGLDLAIADLQQLSERLNDLWTQSVTNERVRRGDRLPGA